MKDRETMLCLTLKNYFGNSVIHKMYIKFYLNYFCGKVKTINIMPYVKIILELVLYIEKFIAFLFIDR